MFVKHEEYFDKSLGQHIIRLRNEHGAEHLIQIQVGHLQCPSCGALHAAPDGDVDVEAITAAHLEALNEHHARMDAYLKKYPLKVK